MNEIETKLNKTWYTVPDIVRLAQEGIFPSKAQKHIVAMLEIGKLKGVEIGVKGTKQWRVSRESLIDFINGGSNEVEHTKQKEEE